MGFIDFIILVILIVAYTRTGDKINSNRFLWTLYAVLGYVSGFLTLSIYVLTLQTALEIHCGKDFATGSFLAATFIIELATGFLFLALLRKLYYGRSL